MADTQSSTFKKVLTTAPSNGNLNGTMAGDQSIAPPNTNPNTGDIATADANIQDAYQKLHGLLTSDPTVDYEAKFSELMQQTQNQPVSENPIATPAGALSGFAYALGAPDKAPALIHERIQKAEAERDKKQQDILSLKEKILQGTIQEEVAKGNFKAALKQTEALDELNRANEDRKRALDMRDWREKQSTKTKDMKTLVQEKASMIVASFHLPERMKLKLMDFVTIQMQERMRQRNLLGVPVEDVPLQELWDEIAPDAADFAQKLLDGSAAKKDEKPTTPAAASTGPDYGAELKRIREAAGKK
jgi:hypothetical protein